MILIRCCPLQVPSQTFPLIVQLLAFRPFRSALLAGLVISVGGLADSLGKASASALLDFLQTRGSTRLDEADRGDSGEGLLDGFADAFKGLFDSDAGLDRVIVPALKVRAAALADVVHANLTSALLDVNMPKRALLAASMSLVFSLLVYGSHCQN